MFGTIGVDISAIRDRGYGTGICRSENFLQETFLPCLFFGKSKALPPIVGYLSLLWVNKSVISLQNNVTSSKDKCNSLLCSSGELISAVKGEHFFQMPITYRQLKGGSGMVKNIGMTRMTRKSRRSSATKGPSKNTVSCMTNTWVPG